ncbi:lysozyme [Halomonas cupida]|uniref:lysozyme n=1 Tax=Halomonas cupida TaxID=44933 RepID=UPI003EF9467E
MVTQAGSSEGRGQQDVAYTGRHDEAGSDDKDGSRSGPLSLYDELAAYIQPPPSRLSPRGRRWLIDAEGCRLLPYHDLTGETLDEWQPGATIGVGHLIEEGQWSRFARGIDLNWADSLLRRDLQDIEQGVLARLEACRPWVGAAGLGQHQFDAMVLLAFNIGVGAFSRSSLASMLCDPTADTPYATLEDAWLAWNRAGGQVLTGLKRRRAGEWKIFSAADYGPAIGND